MAKAQTDPEVREAVTVVLADLWRHVAQRAMDPESPDLPKLPTRLRKLEGLDDLPTGAAPAVLTAAPLLAELTLAALEKSGHVVIPADWLVE